MSEVQTRNVVTPEANLIKKADLARVREADFVTRFNGSIRKLLEVLGVTRKVPKQAGAVLKTLVATGELANGTAAKEGEIIPLSNYKTEYKSYKEITLNKWRKATTAEAIIDRGYDQAVNMTTDKMLKDVQGEVKDNFFGFLSATADAEKGGHGTAATVTAPGLQGALAAAWGQLAVLFEDENIEAVYFVHPLDIADYLAKANITMQTAFGMSYVENFMGMGTVIVSAGVDKGKVFATAKENIVCYYIPVNGADLSNAFSFVADETGYIAIHEEADYTNMTASDTVISGIELFAETEAGVVNAAITPAV